MQELVVVPLVLDMSPAYDATHGALQLTSFPFGEYFVPLPLISFTYRIR